MRLTTEQLYKNHHKAVANYIHAQNISREDAEDVIQETWLKLHALKRATAHSLESYCIVAAKNCLRTCISRRNRRAAREGHQVSGHLTPPEETGDHNNPELILEASESMFKNQAPRVPINYVAEKAIGRRVRELRRSRGLTGAELAARIGKVKGYISKLESGRCKQYNLDTLLNLCREFNCDLETLLGLDG